MLEREWVTVRDPDDDHRRYTFDVSFLLSSYQCIYGAGCPSVFPDTQDGVMGCCQHGAYLNEDDDATFYEEAVREHLDPTTMQYHATALADGIWETDEDGELDAVVVPAGSSP